MPAQAQEESGSGIYSSVVCPGRCRRAKMTNFLRFIFISWSVAYAALESKHFLVATFKNGCQPFENVSVISIVTPIFESTNLSLLYLQLEKYRHIDSLWRAYMFVTAVLATAWAIVLSTGAIRETNRDGQLLYLGILITIALITLADSCSRGAGSRVETNGNDDTAQNGSKASDDVKNAKPTAAKDSNSKK